VTFIPFIINSNKTTVDSNFQILNNLNSRILVYKKNSQEICENEKNKNKNN